LARRRRRRTRLARLLLVPPHAGRVRVRTAPDHRALLALARAERDRLRLLARRRRAAVHAQPHTRRWRNRVRIAALIGLDRTIDFEVTPFDLLRRDAPHEVPVRGEVERLRGPRI